MSQQSPITDGQHPPLAVHLLGLIDYDLCLALQQRILFEMGGMSPPQPVLLLAEHPPLITVGRQGNPGDIGLSSEELASRRVEVRWINRGGPCVVHQNGQLAIYPLLPLEHWHWTAGRYVEQLQAGVQQALAELAIASETRPGRHGLWGRSGLLLAVAAAVRDGITWHGAYLNVAATSHVARQVISDRDAAAPQSSLLAESGRGVRMPHAREALLRHLSAAFECAGYQVHGGHPLLAHAVAVARRMNVRVG